MLSDGLRLIGKALRVAWFVATVGLIGLSILPHGLAAVDREMYVVRGGSMEPAVPIGAVAIVYDTPAPAVRVGDVITFQTANGVVVTHRVVDISTADGLAFRTKGDASPATDAVVVPADAVIGSVEYVVPGLGMLVVLLGSTLGAVATLGLLGGLLLTIFFVDDLAVAVRRSPQRAVLADLPR